MSAARELVRRAKAPARLLLKRPARAALRAWRARRSRDPARLDGPLATGGGRPVRDVSVRPWPVAPTGDARTFRRELAPVLEELFTSGREGKPQALARRFEERWAAHCGVRHALLVPHGTDALRLALAAVLDTDGLEPAGEVIVPNLSFVASAAAALDRRLSVALVDVDPDTLLLDPAAVEAAVVPGRTRAILPVHLFGQPADMAALGAVAERHGLAVVEDAAQAHGAIHARGRAGALGAAGAFSFQSSKNLACGEGGALTTDDDAVYERAFALHDVGRPRVGGERWMHETLGWNVRPSEYVAAVLLQRLGRLEADSMHRAARFAELRAALAELASVRPLGLGPGVVRHGVHMFVVRYDPAACGGLAQPDWLAALRAEGVPIQPLYNGLTQAQQPALRRLAERCPEWLRVHPTPVADRAVREVGWLPHELFLGSAEDVAELAAAFRKVERHYRPVAIASAAPAAANGTAAGNGASSRTGSAAGNGHAADASASARPAGARELARGAARPPVLRVGLVGAGAMGTLHAAALARHAGLALTAVADAAPEAARALAGAHGARVHAGAAELLASDGLDVVLVAVPHREHAAIATAALERGLHVVCEKPLAVTVSEADELVGAAARARGLFSVVFQNRLEPVWIEAHRLIASGELGPVRRVALVEAALRTRGYFEASPWRGTWRGEGGGVLVNQAPHALDRYVWLGGRPERVLGRCDTALHAIEVEDTASAVLGHASGAHGYLHVSTTEAPPLSRALVACDRGRVEVREGRLLVTRLERSVREAAADGAPATKLGGVTRELAVSRLGTIPAQLDAYWANVAAAIRGTEPLAVPGAEALHAVELANAIALSSARGAAVPLPLDRAAVDAWMAERLAGEPAGKAVPV